MDERHPLFGGARADVPRARETVDFALRPITVDDAADDHAALMETRVELRLWEQSDWPTDDFTVEANRADLADLERRHADGRAYTFTVRDPGDRTCLGCVYVFPPDATFLARSSAQPVDDVGWDEVDAVVYFWVRRARADDGTEDRLLATLREWFSDEWGLRRTVFATSELFERQVAVLERAALQVRFELREPDKRGAYLLYG